MEVILPIRDRSQTLQRRAPMTTWSHGACCADVGTRASQAKALDGTLLLLSEATLPPSLTSPFPWNPILDIQLFTGSLLFNLPVDCLPAWNLGFTLFECPGLPLIHDVYL